MPLISQNKAGDHTIKKKSKDKQEQFLLRVGEKLSKLSRPKGDDLTANNDSKLILKTPIKKQRYIHRKSSVKTYINVPKKQTEMQEKAE